MFKKENLDKAFADLHAEWGGKPEFEDVIRHLHLGIAYYDAGKPLKEIDPRAVAIIQKHAPA
jgi:hypothetical protein